MVIDGNLVVKNGLSARIDVRAASGDLVLEVVGSVVGGGGSAAFSSAEQKSSDMGGIVLPVGVAGTGSPRWEAKAWIALNVPPLGRPSIGPW
jgi:hypothetical protein